MLVRERGKRQNQQDTEERDRILAGGGNPDEVFLKRKRVEDFEKKREEFNQQERERQVEIVSRLLVESKVRKRVERQLGKAHWHNRQQVSGYTPPSSIMNLNL